MNDTTSTTRGANEPQHVDPASYGVDPKTGIFQHPPVTPYFQDPRPVKGSLDYFETKEYIHNMTVEGRWPQLMLPGVSFQNIIDMNGRRYMFHYYRTRVNVYDITDAKNPKVLLEKRYGEGEGFFGAAAIAYNKRLAKWIMIQSFEVPRSGPLSLGGAKHTDPARVAKYKANPGFRGIRTYELTGPTEWKQLAEISTDPLHPGAKVQEGSGALDIPTYYGGKYALIAAAPDNTFLHQEYPSYIYSPAQMVYDVEDPANPKVVNTWWVPGQRLGEEDAYRKWRQYENRTSWTGARMPIVVDKPLEAGGRYGYTVMGGLGFHVLDLSDPYNIQTVGSLDLPLNVGGIEGDFVDASRAVERGIVLVNGYPMNEDGYEPYKDIYVIDVRDKAKPQIVATLPRPRPPKEAPYTDFVLRRGKFGPKRSGYYCQPGTPNPHLTVYPFNNAGVQVFDITDPRSAKIVAFFVPRMTDEKNSPDSYKTPMECIAVEWDRKLIWGFASSAVYLLSCPALGTPNFGAPTT
jgi:hypothetical protein